MVLELLVNIDLLLMNLVKMPLLCRVFGHKYVSFIKTKIGEFGLYERHYTTELNTPRCKRCGVKIDKND